MTAAFQALLKRPWIWSFVGAGVVSPVGAVLGALTMAMAASPLLTFMRIPPDWQVGANGAILIIVLAARVAITRKGSDR